MKQIFFVFFISILAMQCTPQANENKEESFNANEKTTTLQNANIEEEIKTLSKQKWQWMADKNVGELAKLFDDKSKFVHMSGTWKKDRELEIINTGSIWYKDAAVHDVAIEVFGKTVLLWNRITLVAHVRGNDVSNEFTVTEIYKNGEDGWKLLDMTFSKVRDTHEIAH
ncbi:nuclear transport factor 2 family protein [Saprospiraceae bacterium]|nr:nuclear transport factor 2 family protein [Saprospiraceae bacterium]